MEVETVYSEESFGEQELNAKLREAEREMLHDLKEGHGLMSLSGGTEAAEMFVLAQGLVGTCSIGDNGSPKKKSRRIARKSLATSKKSKHPSSRVLPLAQV
jgi:hypothetical protein